MRYKEFNENSVLEKCIKLFWKNGFGACAINDIVEYTGVNRYSLYDSFGSKEGILHSTLDLYLERYAQKHLLKLDENGQISDILEAFLMSYLNGSFHREEGCFFIHIATELADRDDIVRKKLVGYLDAIESKFNQLLKHDGYNNIDQISLSKHLIGLFCTSMSFCLIQNEKDRLYHMKNGIKIILKKEIQYA